MNNGKLFSIFAMAALVGVLSVNQATADNVVSDDQIVTGSLGVGFDIATDGTQNFGFSTILLKENNIRITFEDSSSTAGFPTTDWEILVNDTASGGSNYFGVDNKTSGNTALRIFEGISGAVTIGEGATSGGSGTLSVGSVTSTRRIVNVADGIGETDAATVGQLNTAQAAIDENTNDIAALQDQSKGVSWTSDGSVTGASATGTGSTAVGDGAVAGSRDTAVGSDAVITADGSVAVGAGSTVNSANSTAVGADTTIATGAEGSSAIGQNAQVAQGASGSVALGQNSVATAAGTVSVGSAGNERRITNVRTGTANTDAVNVGQMNANILTETNARINADSALQADIYDEATIRAAMDTNLQMGMDTLENRVNRLDTRLDDVGALASAFSALVPNSRACGDTQVSIGLGNYSGSSAMAAGVFHYIDANVLLNAGVSSNFDRRNTATRAGITFGW